VNSTTERLLSKPQKQVVKFCIS